MRLVFGSTPAQACALRADGARADGSLVPATPVLPAETPIFASGTGGLTVSGGGTLTWSSFTVPRAGTGTGFGITLSGTGSGPSAGSIVPAIGGSLVVRPGSDGLVLTTTTAGTGAGTSGGSIELTPGALLQTGR
jgi:hypothetical protein